MYILLIKVMTAIRLNCFISTLIFSFCFATANAGQEEWKLAKDKDGIQVYTRLQEGRKIKEFRAVTVIKASLSSVVALVKDAEVAPEWYNHVRSGKPIKVFDEQRSIIYLELDFPFPATDRDMVARFEYTQDPETKVVRSVVEGMPDYIPEKKGIIRITELEGSWTFTPLPDNKVKVEYQFYADPGGNLPVWAVNMFIVDDPYKSLRRMQEFVEKEKFRNATLDFITE